jgi:glycosyltransferase involved in cell wall biosynthesis
MSVGVSIIICCYNSAARLPKTLEYLANQILPNKVECEVIVVNNNSSDSTTVVAVSEWARLKTSIPLVVINETTPGLSAAREKGISASRFSFVVFCDDDNWLAPDYVYKAYKILSSNSNLAAIGGVNDGVFEVTPPKWMKAFLHSYAIGSQGTSNFEILQGSKYLVGAGLVFNKDFYNEIKKHGFRFYLTDRVGNKIIGGGDVELCYLFKIMGYNIAFSSELKLHHFVPASRLTKKYLKSMWYSYSHSWLIFEAYNNILEKQDVGQIKLFYWRLKAIKKIIGAFRNLPSYINNKLKGNIVYYLPFEAKLLYYFYLLFNVRVLIYTIEDLQRRLNHE